MCDVQAMDDECVRGDSGRGRRGVEQVSVANVRRGGCVGVRGRVGGTGAEMLGGRGIRYILEKITVDNLMNFFHKVYSDKMER